MIFGIDPYMESTLREIGDTIGLSFTIKPWGKLHMLTLSQKKDDEIVVVCEQTGNRLVIKTLEVSGKKVSLGFHDPERNYRITRTRGGELEKSP